MVLKLSSLSPNHLPTHSMRTAAHSVTAAVLRAWNVLVLIMSVWLKHRQDRVMCSPAGRLHQQAESRQERYTMPDSLQRCFRQQILSSLFANATFEAQWVQADRFVSYMGNGADNTGDYVISYNAAQGIDNKYSAFNFKKTGYSGSGNWIQKDQFMNTTGTVSGSGRESMPQLSGLTSIRTKCDVNINAWTLMRQVTITVPMYRYGTA